MAHIEIDFEVWKELTDRRESETTTYNEVIRRLLKLKPPLASSSSSQLPEPVATQRPWIPTHGVSFPAGTEFRAVYKGQTILGRVEAGSLVVNGKKFKSPSGAAMSITGSPVNGWLFWEYRLPGDDWKPIDTRRSMALSS